MKQTLIAAIGFVLAATPMAQAQQPAVTPPSIESGAQTAFGALPGRWVRVEGGYVINIKAIDASGKLDANYANPNPLPFFTAVVTDEGDKLKLFFELRAGGYNGSTYTLKYDAASDRLTGVYYQAVAKQQFEVVFVRSK